VVAGAPAGAAPAAAVAAAAPAAAAPAAAAPAADRTPEVVSTRPTPVLAQRRHPSTAPRPRRAPPPRPTPRAPPTAEDSPARPTPTAPATVDCTTRTRTACTGNAVSTSASPTRTAPRRRSAAARPRTTEATAVITRTSAFRPIATWTPTAVRAASVRPRPATAVSSRASIATKRPMRASIPPSTARARARSTAPASTPRPPARGPAGQAFARADVAPARWLVRRLLECGRCRCPAGNAATNDPVVSGNLSPASCSVAAVVVEQPAEARPASNHAGRPVVVARRRRRPDDLAADRLVMALGEVVLPELLEQVAQVPFAEDDEVVQALVSDRFHETLGVRVAVGALRRNRHALHAAAFPQRRPRLREHRVPIVDQVGRVAQESVCQVEQIADNLLHPIAVGSNANPCDLHGARLHLDHEEHHVADRPEHAQDLDAEEVARVQRLPVALEKLRPGPLAVAFRRRFDAGFRQHGGHRRAADLDLQPAQRVADPGVAPARVVARKLEHELAD